jgi:hypothetical protein
MPKTTINYQQEIKLELNAVSTLTPNQYLRIDNLQLDISFGPNMLGKRINIKAYGIGDEMWEFQSVELFEMHHQLVDTDLDSLQMRWQVERIEFKPCQENNHPIFVGVRSLNLP